MKILFQVFILCIIILAITPSCDKIQSYPPEPHISFESYRLIDTVDKFSNPLKRLFVTFTFVDGDGDLFNPNALSDTLKNDTTTRSKLHYTYYKKTNGQFQQIADSIMQTRFSFGWNDEMSRDGQNKTQKGTIEFHNDFYLLRTADTIKLTFYIEDMAYHKSNVDSIPGYLILKQ